MKNIRYKVLGAMLTTAITFTVISPLVINDTKIVHAAESDALKNAKAKISHLTKSLKTNYLGIKNQGSWQLYIAQARKLIKAIPYYENVQREALTIEVTEQLQNIYKNMLKHITFYRY